MRRLSSLARLADFQDDLRESVVRVFRVVSLRFSALGLSLVFSIISARVLGSEEFGRYTLAMAFIGLLTVAVNLGLPQLTEREIAAARGTKVIDRLVPIVHGAAFLNLIALIALSFSWLFIADPGPLICVAIVASLPISFLGAVLTGYERVETYTLANSLLRPIASITALLLLTSIYRPSFERAIEAQVLAALTTSAFLIFVLRSLEIPLVSAALWQAWRDWRPSKEHKIIVYSGFHFAMIQLMINATQQAEVFWLSALATPEDVAHFFAATRAGTAVSLFHASVIALYTPKIIRLHAERAFEARDTEIMHATKISFALTVLASLGAAAISETYLRCFGDNFVVAQVPMFFLLAGWVALAALGPVTQVMMMSGHEASLWIGIIIGLCVGGLTALLIIPRLGLMGASLSFNAMILSAHVFLLPKVRRVIGFMPFGAFRL